MQYQVTWTGPGAVPTANLACRWQAMQGTCTADPTKEFLIGITWPTAGPWTISVTATDDMHDNIHRVFLPARPVKPITVTVGPGS